MGRRAESAQPIPSAARQASDALAHVANSKPDLSAWPLQQTILAGSAALLKFVADALSTASALCADEHLTCTRVQGGATSAARWSCVLILKVHAKQ